MSFTSESLYIYVLDLINKNATNARTHLSKREFVELYKVNSVRYISYLLNNRGDDLIRTISNLRTFDYGLEEIDTESTYNEYKFPEDYLDFINLSAKFKNDKCKEIKSQVMTEVKPEEIDKYYNDPYNEPSLRAAETLYNMSGEGVIVYKKGFEIKSVDLYYYRKPIEIDIVGYERLDGSPSTNINPDLSSPALTEIAIMIAKQFAGAVENSTQYQILTQTQQIKK